jgi:hypothetical protein
MANPTPPRTIRDARLIIDRYEHRPDRLLLQYFPNGLFGGDGGLAIGTRAILHLLDSRTPIVYLGNGLWEQEQFELELLRNIEITWPLEEQKQP